MEKYQWIKLDVDIFNNRKIKKIESEPDGQLMVLIWIKLLVLSAKIKDNGQVYITKNVGYSIKELANELGYFGKKLEKIIEKSLKLFQNLEMLEINESIITINNWHRYQDYEKEENARKLNAERQRKFRESKSNVGKEYSTNNSDITHTVQLHNAIDKDVDVDVEVEEDKEERREITHFVRNKESDGKMNQPLSSSPEPTYIGQELLQHHRLKELLQTYPMGFFLGKEQRIINLTEEEYSQFKAWLHDNERTVSYMAIKQWLLRVETKANVI